MGDEDKQFAASAQKLKKAREEGNVIKSKDFSTAISLLMMFAALNALGPLIWEECQKIFILIYEQIPNKSIENIGAQYLGLIALLPTFIILGPILLIAIFVGVMGDMIQVGPMLTTATLVPKLDKLNPINGFKNLMFSMKTMFELAKNIAKVLLLGFIAYIVFKAHFPSILKLCEVSNTFSIIIIFGKLIMDFVTKAGIVFLIISGADYGFTRWKFLKDQKMSFKEVKDEYKNSEGDPHVKAALRQRRMQMLQQAMLEAIPSADFVTTNPLHVAVAVKYDAKQMAAPRVIAKGTELFAKKIIGIAKKYNVPVIENPPVARALFRFVDVNMEVPPELYKAVAEILMFVYNLRKNK